VFGFTFLIRFLFVVWAVYCRVLGTLSQIYDFRKPTRDPQ